MTFVFQSEEQWVGDADVFVAHISCGLSTRELLFDALSKELQFPDYFGRNWDALFDCLRDLSWIPQKKVVLIHRDVPKLEPAAIKVYLKLLDDAVAGWKEGEGHEVVVVFPEEAEETVREAFPGE